MKIFRNISLLLLFLSLLTSAVDPPSGIRVIIENNLQKKIEKIYILSDTAVVDSQMVSDESIYYMQGFYPLAKLKIKLKGQTDFYGDSINIVNRQTIKILSKNNKILFENKTTFHSFLRDYIHIVLVSWLLVLILIKFLLLFHINIFNKSIIINNKRKHLILCILPNALFLCFIVLIYLITFEKSDILLYFPLFLLISTIFDITLLAYNYGKKIIFPTILINLSIFLLFIVSIFFLLISAFSY